MWVVLRSPWKRTLAEICTVHDSTGFVPPLKLTVSFQLLGLENFYARATTLRFLAEIVSCRIAPRPTRGLFRAALETLSNPNVGAGLVFHQVSIADAVAVEPRNYVVEQTSGRPPTRHFFGGAMIPRAAKLFTLFWVCTVTASLWALRLDTTAGDARVAYNVGIIRGMLRFITRAQL